MKVGRAARAATFKRGHPVKSGQSPSALPSAIREVSDDAEEGRDPREVSMLFETSRTSSPAQSTLVGREEILLPSASMTRRFLRAPICGACAGEGSRQLQISCAGASNTGAETVSPLLSAHLVGQCHERVPREDERGERSELPHVTGKLGDAAFWARPDLQHLGEVTSTVSGTSSLHSACRSRKIKNERVGDQGGHLELGAAPQVIGKLPTLAHVNSQLPPRVIEGILHLCGRGWGTGKLLSDA